MNTTLFIADSHLIPETKGEAFFRSFLKKIEKTDYDIVFLGDIFDLWIAVPGFESQIQHDFIDWCSTEKQKRNIYFIEGNHEFYIKEAYPEAFTAIFTKGLVCDGEILALHGDLLNRRDILYFLLRILLRNRFARFLCKLTGKTIGPRIAAKIRTNLHGTNQRQKRYFPEKELLKLSEQTAGTNIRHIVLGHYHRAAQVGKATVLAPCQEPDWPTMLYSHNKGRTILSAQKVFQE